MPEHLPAVGAQQARGLFFLGALFLHQRDQLAGDEGHGDEDGRQDDAGHGEDDLDVAILQPLAEVALGAEQQHVDQAGDHRRDRERQVDQGHQQALAAELVLAHAPGGGDAEHQVERHRDEHGDQRQLQRGERIRFEDGGEEGAQALLQCLAQHHQQRQQEEQGEGQPGAGDQDAATPGAAPAGGIGGGRGGQRCGTHGVLLKGFRCGAAAG
ncbi:hypothetical protein D3C78_1308400 [compost metagenome]